MPFWEPGSLSQIVGNATALGLLRAILLAKEHTPRGFIIDGPSGCGKSIMAKLFAKEANGEAVIHTVEPAKFGSFLRQEDVKDYPIIVWDRADMLTKEQAVQITSMLDKPSYRGLNLFTTPHFYQVDPAIRSRALRISCGVLSEKEMSGLLVSVCAHHSINWQGNAIQELARQSCGVPALGLSSLQAVSMLGDITMENLHSAGIGLASAAHRLLESIKDPWVLIQEFQEKYPVSALIEEMFQVYSQAFVDQDQTILNNLGNLSHTTSVFLRWRHATGLPPSSLALFICDLTTLPATATASAIPEMKPKEVRTEAPLSASELEDIFKKAQVTGDITLR